MEKLIEDIEKIEFTSGKNFSYNLDREFDLIASNLEPTHKDHLRTDFNRFLEKEGLPCSTHLVVEFYI